MSTASTRACGCSCAVIAAWRPVPQPATRISGASGAASFAGSACGKSERSIRGRGKGPGTGARCQRGYGLASYWAWTRRDTWSCTLVIWGMARAASVAGSSTSRRHMRSKASPPSTGFRWFARGRYMPRAASCNGVLAICSSSATRAGAAPLERGRGERLSAQRGHLALEALVGDERMLEEEQEKPAARAQAHKAQDRLGAGLDVDLALGEEPLAVGGQVRVPGGKAAYRQDLGEELPCRAMARIAAHGGPRGLERGGRVVEVSQRQREVVMRVGEARRQRERAAVALRGPAQVAGLAQRIAEVAMRHGVRAVGGDRAAQPGERALELASLEEAVAEIVGG